MAVLRRALLWAISGSVIGAVLWAVIGGSVWLALHPRPTLAATLGDWPLTVLGTGYWALYISAVAAPCYTVVFVLWQVVVGWHPEFDATPRIRVLSALALAAPPVALLTVGFAWNDPYGFNWREAAQVFPVAAASCWSGVYAPRQLFSILRPPIAARAG